MTLRSSFWNASERRLRAGWRLAVQLALNLGGALILMRWVAPQTALDRWPRLVVEAAGYPLVLGVTVLSVWFAGRFLDRRAWRDFGFDPGARAWWADFGAGFAVGAGLVSGCAWAATALGLLRFELTFTSGIPGVGFPLALLLSALSYGAVGAFEELARAYQMRNLFEAFSGRLGLRQAALAATCGAALVSVLMHRGDAAFILFVFVSMSIQGLFYLLTGRVALIAGYHMAWDFTLTAIFGVEALSGLDYTSLFTPRMADVIQPGAAGVQIASYGPLALLGVAAVAAQLGAWLAMAAWVRWRTGAVRLRAGMARPTRLDLSPDAPPAERDGERQTKGRAAENHIGQ